MPWRVATVRAIANERLDVQFNDGTQGIVDLSALLASASAGVFASLRDRSLFERVHVELGTVTWPNGLDLAPDAMHAAIRRDGIWRP